jgi:hypothetical protein
MQAIGEERKADESVRLMLEMFDKDKNPNADERKSGKNAPPRLLEYLPYGSISRKVNTAEHEKAFRARNSNTFEHKHGVWSGALLLKESEKKRFDSEIESELENRDKTFESLSLQENVTRPKKALEVNEEAHSGQFDVGIIKFFKPI